MTHCDRRISTEIPVHLRRWPAATSGGATQRSATSSACTRSATSAATFRQRRSDVHAVFANEAGQEHRLTIASGAADADLGQAPRQLIARELALAT
jgi:hypothetical protein